MRTIKVLVVEDSLLFRELLVQSLNREEGIEVVATASDPFEARDMLMKHHVDVMTLDVEMPKMDGIEFLRKLMPQYPLPVVVVSCLSDKVFHAMNAGAVDFVAKPSCANKEQLEEFIKNELIVKLKIASIAKIGTIKNSIKQPVRHVRHENLQGSNQELVVAIGASTGGTEAIASVMKDLSPDIPGIVIVQHMPSGFTEMFAKRLNDQSKIVVKEAQNGDIVRPGQALLAPGGDSHMELVKRNGNYQVVLKKAPKVNGHCPSVDVLFHSVAKVAGKNALGIILTGMGGDGAKGLLAMRNAGAKTIGQDESTCVVYGMPKVAYEMGAVMHQEKLQNVAKRAYSLLNQVEEKTNTTDRKLR